MKNVLYIFKILFIIALAFHEIGTGSAQNVILQKVQATKFINTKLTIGGNIHVHDSLILFHSSTYKNCIDSYNMRNNKLQSFTLPYDGTDAGLLWQISTNEYGIFATTNHSNGTIHKYKAFYLCNDSLIEIVPLSYNSKNFEHIKDYEYKLQTNYIIRNPLFFQSQMVNDFIITTGTFPNGFVQIRPLLCDTLEIYGAESPDFPVGMSHDERMAAYFTSTTPTLIIRPGTNNEFVIVYYGNIYALQTFKINKNKTISNKSKANIFQTPTNISIHESDGYYKFKYRDTTNKVNIFDTLARITNKRVNGIITPIWRFAISAAASGQRIFVLYSNKPYLQHDSHLATNLHIYNWQGELISKHNLSTPLYSIAFDYITGKLYGFGRDNINIRNSAMYEIIIKQ